MLVYSCKTEIEQLSPYYTHGTGHVGLIDFNVATKISSEDKMTSLKGLYGTPPYIAPEM